jgi:hypothetical protein
METNLKELNVEQNELDDFQKVEQKARRLIGGRADRARPAPRRPSPASRRTRRVTGAATGSR